MNNIYPCSINMKLAQEKGLVTDNKLNSKYFNIQKNYKVLFEKYIAETLDLKKYDDLLANSDLKIDSCMPYRMDYYQKNSTLDLKYIYIKNNLHIEKLAKEDLDSLELGNDEELLKKIVKKTYSDVIKINYLNEEEIKGNFKTQYFEGFDSPNTIFNNDSLVLIIREGKLKTKLSNKELVNYINKRQMFIASIIEKMNNDFHEKLKCNIEIGHLLH